jgi:hypothetical protein
MKDNSTLRHAKIMLERKIENCYCLQGKGEDFLWEIVLAYRQNFGSSLVQKEGCIKAENGFADIWVTEKDCLEWSQKQKANIVYLEKELPKAKQEREQAIQAARNAGATEHQIASDFATRYDSRVLQNLPFKEVFDTRVARVAVAPELFCRLAKQEVKRMMFEKKVALESMIPLLEPTKILRGYQPVLKVTWNLDR